MKKKYLVIIPARSGSKRIKDKNIVDLCGKPLIAYTINVALKLKNRGIVEKVIVSTDSVRIARIAKNLGAEVPFLRPKRLAGDKSKSADFVLHALNFFEGKNIYFDTVIILQPTSPLRNYDDIKNSINLFEKHNNDSLISVYREETINDLIMYRKSGFFGIPLNKNHNIGIRRQEEKVYIRNGAVYLIAAQYVRRTKKIISNRPLLYEMPKKRSVNIDSREDLKKARCILCR